MELGASSVCLSVKDIHASKAFYEKFGPQVIAGDTTQNWLILRNGDHTIGLFHGMFEGNMLTFNPVWDQHCTSLSSFTDVRQIQQQLKAQGIALISEADESTSGPVSLMAVDPDGNTLLLDQHV